ncbi:MAG: MgtC/SapB family protein [Chloroflexi bacterium]|nr:MgtC/SapB family protein [Chloroflexota bacterium]
MPWWEVLVRLVLATLMGAMIGWDRERTGKPAGLRTLMLVALASCTYYLAAAQATAAMGVPPDTIRAMAGIVGGVGFLGAGIIMRSNDEIYWLTTAAALWAAAALGMAAGMGVYYITVLSGLLVLIILSVLPALEKHISNRRRKKKTPPPQPPEPHNPPDN